MTTQMQRGSGPTVDIPPGYDEVHSASLDGFGRSIGPVFVDTKGKRIAFRVDEQHVNVTGNCHGGALSTFADSQLAAIRADIVGIAGHSPTISLAVDFIGPAPLGSLVEMSVTLLRQTRTMFFTHGIMAIDDEVIGRTNAHYRYYTKSPSP